jgi:hypothetical protein
VQACRGTWGPNSVQTARRRQQLYSFISRCSRFASSWLHSVMVYKLYKVCRCCWTSNDRLAQPIHQLSPTCMSAAPMPSPLSRRVSVEVSLSHATAFLTAANYFDSVGQLQRAFYPDMTSKSGSTRTQSAVLTARLSRQISDFSTGT